MTQGENQTTADHRYAAIAHDPLPDEHAGTERVSTGVLPSDTDVQALVTAGYERYRHLDEGAVADYIPALAAASPSAFGVCVAGVHGRLFSIGDADQEFAIESVSKLFVFALVCHTLGHEEARRKLGVNSTGLPGNSVRGQRITRYLSEALGLNLFASAPTA